MDHLFISFLGLPVISTSNMGDIYIRGLCDVPWVILTWHRLPNICWSRVTYFQMHLTCNCLYVNLSYCTAQQLSLYYLLLFLKVIFEILIRKTASMWYHGSVTQVFFSHLRPAQKQYLMSCQCIQKEYEIMQLLLNNIFSHTHKTFFEHITTQGIKLVSMQTLQAGIHTDGRAFGNTGW